MAVVASAEVTLTRISVDETTQQHFWHDSAGAHVSESERPASGSISGGNALITSGGMQVRNGSSVLAEFGASKIELGKSSASSTVSMCGGRIAVSASSDAVGSFANSMGASVGFMTMDNMVSWPVLNSNDGLPAVCGLGFKAPSYATLISGIVVYSNDGGTKSSIAAANLTSWSALYSMFSYVEFVYGDDEEGLQGQG